MSNASNICLSFNTNKIKYIKTKVEQVFLFLFCDLGSINTNRSARIFFIAANTQLEIKKMMTMDFPRQNISLHRVCKRHRNTYKSNWHHVIGGRW